MRTWLKRQVRQAFSQSFLGAGDAHYVDVNMRALDALPGDLAVLAWLGKCEPYINALVAKSVWIDPVEFDRSIHSARLILDALSALNSKLKDEIESVLTSVDDEESERARWQIYLTDDVSILSAVQGFSLRLKALIADRLGVSTGALDSVLIAAAMIKRRSFQPSRDFKKWILRGGCQTTSHR